MDILLLPNLNRVQKKLANFSVWSKNLAFISPRLLFHYFHLIVNEKPCISPKLSILSPAQYFLGWGCKTVTLKNIKWGNFVISSINKSIVTFWLNFPAAIYHNIRNITPNNVVRYLLRRLNDTLTLRKIPWFYLIYWCGNFVERHSFPQFRAICPEIRKLENYVKLGEIMVF